MGKFRIHTGRLLALPIFFVVHHSYGQISTETESIVSTMGFSVACLVVVILGWIIMRRVGGRRRDGLSGAAGLDMMELRKKNLLTPEELAKVSGAIARQMAQKDAARQKLAATPSSDALLNDPEVRRLEALAMAAKAADAQARTAARPEPEQELAAEPVAEASATSAGDSIESVESLDDVILPLDVQQLADAGILTPGEIENVKRRLKAREQ